jgi:hypothetical protein
MWECRTLAAGAAMGSDLRGAEQQYQSLWSGHEVLPKQYQTICSSTSFTVLLQVTVALAVQYVLLSGSIGMQGTFIPCHLTLNQQSFEIP